MSHDEIITQLTQITENASEIIYCITMQSIIRQIVQRMSADALSLSVEDLQLAMAEVKEAISHNLDEREYIDMGLDAWEVIRNL